MCAWICIYTSKKPPYSALCFVHQNDDHLGYKGDFQRQIVVCTILFHLAPVSLRTGRSKQLDLELVLQIYMMNQCLWLLLKQIQLHICSLFFVVRIGAKHQELRQKQLRGLLDYSTGPGGPDIDDDEVDPNYARVNHFREAYPAASIYRPSSPAVAETFVYPRDSASAPMEREHLEGLYAKINKQHYPQTPGDR